jgi:hypothetical protein
VGDPSRDYAQMASGFDLRPHEYVEEEYLFEGVATSYETPPLADGVVLSTGHPYRSRLLVRRPLDASMFNGTAIVEWLNVSAHANVDQLWWETGERLVARGYAYVGVSAQRAGVHSPVSGLRAWSPARYASLDLTDGGLILDDSLCYDVFSQAALAAWGEADIKPLGDLVPQRVVAYGGSQSQDRLVNYHNSIQPLAGAFDAFVLGIGAGALRTDVDVKAFRVNTETDVLLTAGASRQADSDRYRNWEITGSSHLSFQMATYRERIVARGDIAPIQFDLTDRPPLSRVPWGQPLAAAFLHVDRWLRDGVEPPRAAPIELTSIGPEGSIPARDETGHAIGGLRLSQVAVPTALNDGLNSGAGFSPYYGSHVPFGTETLRRLYPSHDAYVERVRVVDEANVEAGYIVEESAEENLIEALAFTAPWSGP